MTGDQRESDFKPKAVLPIIFLTSCDFVLFVDYQIFSTKVTKEHQECYTDCGLQIADCGLIHSPLTSGWRPAIARFQTQNDITCHFSNFVSLRVLRGLSDFFHKGTKTPSDTKNLFVNLRDLVTWWPAFFLILNSYVKHQWLINAFSFSHLGGLCVLGGK